MFIRRQFDKVIMAGMVIVFFLYMSYQRTFRLSPEAPVEFLSESASLPKQKRLQEEKIARAYWQCAVGNIQWKYRYGDRLPEQAPAEFLVTDPSLGPRATSAETRLRYWRKLAQVWYLPSSWSRGYQWDFGWPLSWAEGALQWTREHVGRAAQFP